MQKRKGLFFVFHLICEKEREKKRERHRECVCVCANEGWHTESFSLLNTSAKGKLGLSYLQEGSVLQTKSSSKKCSSHHSHSTNKCTLANTHTHTHTHTSPAEMRYDP